MGFWNFETDKTLADFNILLPDFAEKKDAATTKSFMPHYRANSLSMGFGSVSPPRQQLDEVVDPEKGKGKRSVLGKLTHAGKKSALRLLHGGQSPKKTTEGKGSPENSPKKSSKKPLLPKRKEDDTILSDPLDQTDVGDIHLNAIHSTRSLWGHFGRGSNTNLAAKQLGDAAQSAPAGPPKQKATKKPKLKASVVDLQKSPRKLKHKISGIDLEKSPRKLKHDASAIDLEKSPRKLKHKASAIELETAAAAAEAATAKAATRKRVWLLADDDEDIQEYAC